MKQDIKELEEKLDKVLDKVTSIEVTVAKQEVNLENNTESLVLHMKRTEIAESRIDKLEADKVTKEDLEPLKKHVAFVKGAAWMLGIAGTILLALISTGIIKKVL